MSSATQDQGSIDKWIGPKEAAKILEVGVHAVYRMLDSGVLTCRRLPGTHPRVLRSDVERLLRESVVRAK